MFTLVRPAAPADVAEFVGWQYEPPYDVYNLTQSLDEAVEYFTSTATQCHVVEAEDGLAGYCTFGQDARVPGGDYSKPGLDIGTALKPALTGRGYGTDFVATIVAFAVGAFEPQTLRVSIAATNQRAVKVWIANGFIETQRFHTSQSVLGTTEFLVFERDPVAS